MKPLHRLITFTLHMVLPDLTAADEKELAPIIGPLLEQALSAETPNERERVVSYLSKVKEHSHRGPPGLARWISIHVGQLALYEIAKSQASQPLEPDQLRQQIVQRVKALPAAELSQMLEAAIRYRLNRATDSDQSLLRTLLDENAASKEDAMAIVGQGNNVYTWDFDSRGLPQGWLQNSKGSWTTAVNNELSGNLGLDVTNPANDTIVSAIMGMLLLDESFDTSATGFSAAIVKEWQESLGKTTDYSGNQQPNRAIYDAVAQVMASTMPSTAPILYQQFAAVSRYVIANATNVPLGHPNFASQVRIGMDQYVAGTPPFESLDLPPLTGADGGTDGEIVQENLQAFSMIFAAYHLELMKLPTTVERILEQYLNGTLPTGYDDAGRALDTWYWNRQQRMTEPERWMIYSRTLGVSGGELPKDLQPNTGFMDLFMRFLGSIAEYDRQSRISSLFNPAPGSNRSLSSTMENVRQAGHALGVSATLYSYGYAHYSSRRVATDIRSELDILSQPGVLKAFGVSTAYQVIERVSIAEDGKSPEIPRLRTMAESGKKILDIVAKYPNVWSASSGVPLFPDPAQGPGSDISADDTAELTRQTQYLFAVNAVSDTQADKLSTPAPEQFVSSIPSLNGASPTPPPSGVTAGLDKIKQMISAGQTPSLDQLKQILPSVAGA
jgi:hypothetical protein